MESSKKYIIVTGSNKGIGRATLEGILERETDYGLIMTCRRQEDGEKAIEEIKAMFPGLSSYPSLVLLDLLDDQSISLFCSTVLEKFKAGSVKVFINNAGLSFDQIDDEKNSLIWRTNYVQTRKITEKVLESGILDSHAKIVNVSS